MSIGRTLRVVPIVVAIGLTAAACGGNAVAAQCIDDGMTITVPATIGELYTSPSDEARDVLLKEKEETKTYICDASVYEYRAGPASDDELIAVLEIIRMTDDARLDDVDFLRGIANDIGAGQQVPEQIDGVFVWQTGQNQQTLHIWFQERFMQVLIIRDTTMQGDAVDAETILRDTLALKPARA